jgi:DNA-binding CsgD family transcriptional regulator
MQDALISPPEDIFSLDQLSPREREILELATQGRTDEQIAQGMGISTSTVNSYWVRIRGKLGQLSRTELVGKTLRREMVQTQQVLREENRRLHQLLKEHTARLEELTTTLRALHGDAADLIPALAHLPQPTIVTGPPATILYANREASRLYSAEDDSLEGTPMAELCTDPTPEAEREPCRELFQEGGPERRTVGLSEPYHARRLDGSSFRAVVRAVRYETASGPLAVVTVESLADCAENVATALRNTFAA